MNRREFLRSTATIGFAATGCWRQPSAQPTTPTTAVAERLFDLMSQRLAIMVDVARTKWNSKGAIEDPARERALVASMADAGREFKLEPAETTAFFTAQIEASKIIQREKFREWEAEGRGPFTDAPDLVRDLRPKIDAVGRELLETLAAFKAGGQIPAGELRRLAATRIVGPGVTDEVRAAAVRPLTDG
ncbi:MAG: chorismate mutase AroQ, gamma subclass [Planctomycetaceae bacterium]|nr:chorismate mutase AroQ, gamma subclass [Planctomycetaceae bacterium]